jgi:hypothetical protein
VIGSELICVISLHETTGDRYLLTPKQMEPFYTRSRPHSTSLNASNVSFADSHEVHLSGNENFEGGCKLNFLKAEPGELRQSNLSSMRPEASISGAPKDPNIDDISDPSKSS